MPDALHFQPAHVLADLVRRRQLSPLELMEATLARIEAVDPKTNAFCQLDADAALAEARSQTERLARGEDLGPLAGLPLGVKELENATGFRSTMASRFYEDRWAETDDVHVARLKAAGAIVIGKTNSPEFGYTAFTTNDLFGTTRNPWDLTRTPGGSSGGSAAAIAAGLVPLVTASDGGGSIRIPACFCGTYGFKPTFGLVPIGPREAPDWTDTTCYGPLTRTVRDAALYLDQVAGYDPSDQTSLPKPAETFLAALDRPLPKLRIGVNRLLGAPAVQSDVLREFESAVAVFAAMGHELEDNVESLEEMTGHWIRLTRFQTLATLGREVVEANAEKFTRSYYNGFLLARDVGPKEFGAAYAARGRINAALRRLFERYDLLLTPTMPLEAFAAEGPLPRQIEGVSLGGGIIAFTAPFNFSGYPAATVRSGFTDAGLPAGLQIAGRRHEDALVLQASLAYEQARPWNDHWPEL
jgi:aspartyl-tRNA(Asn)/glutamyl-tRNA(Gln) amidotransferase subunit A